MYTRFVNGDLIIPDSNVFVIDNRSYVCPSGVITGSSMISMVIGQKNSCGHAFDTKECGDDRSNSLISEEDPMTSLI